MVDIKRSDFTDIASILEVQLIFNNGETCTLIATYDPRRNVFKGTRRAPISGDIEKIRLPARTFKCETLRVNKGDEFGLTIAAIL